MMLTVWAVCAADGTVTIGGVELPADCALAHREHPRLLFTKADLLLHLGHSGQAGW